MGVKAGYKTTEVGVIPKDWEVKAIEDITTNIGDGLHGTPNYSINGAHPFVNGNNLRGGKIAITPDTQYVDHEEYLRHRKQLNENTILMSINGTIGNLAFYGGEEVVLGKSVAYLNLKNGFSKHFVYQSLQSEGVIRQFQGGLTGSTIGNLGLATIRNTKLAIPPAQPEQDIIAKFLCDLDLLSDKIKRHVVKKRCIRLAAMQGLLMGRVRLPGFTEKWSEKQFSSVIARVYPKSNLCSGDGLESGGFPLYVSGGEPKRTETVQFQNTSALVFSDGGVFSVRLATGDFSVTDHCYVITLDKKVADMKWFESWFILNAAEMDRTVFKGSGLRNLDKFSLHALKILCPSLPEQVAISNVLNDMESEILSLETRHAKMAALKHALIQELLTGKIRLVPTGAARA